MNTTGRIAALTLALLLGLCAAAGLAEGALPFDTGFTFGCDGAEVTIPCSYAEFVESAGLALDDPRFAPDPSARPEDVYEEYKEFGILNVPGTSFSVDVGMRVASYVLGEDGGHIKLRVDGQQLFEGETYGDCQVYQVFAYLTSWADSAAAERCVFPCGVTLGMSRDEVYMRLGSLRKEVQNASVDYAVFVDGDYVVTVGFHDDMADNIEMDFDHEFAMRQ